MSKTVWTILLLVVVSILIAAIWSYVSVDNRWEEEAAGHPQSTVPATSDADSEQSGLSDLPVEAESLRFLREDLAEATAAVEAAEYRLDDLALSLDNAEGQMAGIEARRDGPTAQADEMMPNMESVLDEHLDAQSELDAARERQRMAVAALEEAMDR